MRITLPALRVVVWHLLVSIVVVLLFFGPSLSDGAAAPAQAVEPAVIFSALQLIRANYVDTPDPVKLLAGALEGLRQALSRTGVTERLADLDATNESSARASFTSRFNQALTLLQGRMPANQLEYAAIRAMAASLGDEDTFFMSPEEVAQSRQTGFTGTGIRYRRVDGGIYIWQVFSGGPAAQAGVQELDQLMAVDGQSVQGLTDDDLRNRIRGPQGSTVRFTIRRAGQAAPLTLSITRDLIIPTSVARRMLQAGTGFVRLSDFARGASSEMRRTLEDLARQGMRALILDLRLNFSGSFAELDQTAGLLLPGGLIVYSVTGKEPRTQRTIGSPVVDPAVRVVVLVDGETLSLGELLAAAIMEHGRGRLVGVRTAGAGGTGRDFDLAGGATLRVKTGRVSTGKGVSLDGNGIRPDVEVMLRAADLDRGQDPQLARALQIVSQ